MKSRKNKKKDKNSLYFDVVSLNSKGQIVIPARIRKEMGLSKNSKLLLVSHQKEAIVLIKVKSFLSKIKELQNISNKIELA